MTAGRDAPHWPSAATTVVGIIGDPVAHSLSPLLHNAAFAALGLDWVSVGFAVAPGRAAAALEGMRALRVAGLSVTMPHKSDVAALVDERTAVAERLGAVNCVTRRGEVLLGHNTDGEGLVASLRHGAGFDPAGRRALVVGAGGAGRAAVLALAEAGASEVVVVNRSADRAAIAAALAGPVGRVGTPADAADADLVVEATPVGMDGVADDAVPLVDPAGLGAGQLAVDLVYRPAQTAWLAAAAANGAAVLGGLGMLVHQAAAIVAAWTGRDAPVAAMWRAATEVLDGP
ncbi:MAG TPA: shikimate dehydrogenase [Acidimicrobiales bacterium]|nr:shikimate dehydrogenase [Acidimicrobiales bacterium]